MLQTEYNERLAALTKQKEEKKKEKLVGEKKEDKGSRRSSIYKEVMTPLGSLSMEVDEESSSATMKLKTFIGEFSKNIIKLKNSSRNIQKERDEHKKLFKTPTKSMRGTPKYTYSSQYTFSSLKKRSFIRQQKSSVKISEINSNWILKRNMINSKEEFEESSENLFQKAVSVNYNDEAGGFVFFYERMTDRMKVKAEGIQFIFINDSQAVFSPVLNVKIKRLWFETMKEDEKMVGKTNILLSSYYYNPRASAWEPFLEKTNLSLKLLKTPNRADYKISITDGLNLNISDTLVQMLYTISSSLKAKKKPEGKKSSKKRFESNRKLVDYPVCLTTPTFALKSDLGSGEMGSPSTENKLIKCASIHQLPFSSLSKDGDFLSEKKRKKKRIESTKVLKTANMFSPLVPIDERKTRKGKGLKRIFSEENDYSPLNDLDLPLPKEGSHFRRVIENIEERNVEEVVSPYSITNETGLVLFVSKVYSFSNNQNVKPQIYQLLHRNSLPLIIINRGFRTYFEYYFGF
jgi:hypothetical protein